MYERFEQVKKQRSKVSSFGVARFDKTALAIGGYSFFVPGMGIIDESRSEIVYVAGQQSQVQVDYPFPGKLPNLDVDNNKIGPINWAKDFKAFLESFPIEVEPYELLVGDAHWNMFELKGRKYLNRGKLMFMRKKANDLGADGMGWSRTSPDYKIGLMLGWDGILDKISKYYKKYSMQGKKEECEFLQGAKITCKAMMDFINRHSLKASDLSSKEKNVELKKNYEKVAKACRNIASKPPSSFYEAILWLSFHALVDRSAVGPCGGYGRPDTVLDSYYYNDIKNNRITKEEAQELVSEYLLKRPFYIGIGGRDKESKDVTNEVSWLFLNAIEQIPDFVNLGILWHKDIDKNFYRKACEISLKRGLEAPMLLNYDVMKESLINYGIDEEDACDVAFHGCAWYSVPGKEYLCGDMAGINLTMCLVNTLKIAFDIKIKSFDELWNIFSIEVDGAISALKELTDEELEQYPKIWPEILPSLLSDGCIEKGKDITDAALKYNYLAVQAVGISNAVDSLVAIKNVIFNKKLVSLDDLEKAIANNFEGYETIREHLLNSPKFGNDDDEADNMATRVLDLFREHLSRYKSRRGFHYRPAIWSHIGHIYSGNMLGATPDGRKAGEPLAQGPNPMHGRNTNGITATARSISKLKPNMLLECPYQLEVDPFFFNDVDDKVKLYYDITTSCFKMGLVQIEGNLVSLETLKKAQENPENYRNLMVRVTGFSARFVELNEEAQEEIIGRYKQSAL